MNENQVYAKNMQYDSEMIENIMILSSDEKDKCIYLSDTAVDIYEKCDGIKSIYSIIQELIKEYDVTEDVCRKDVFACVEQLVKENILEEV